MSYIDEQTKELYAYLPPQTKQPDFDEFWSNTLAQSKAQPLDAVTQEVTDYPLDMKIEHVTYKGFDGVPVTAWFIKPAHTEGKLPCILHYHGFSDFKGKPYIYTHFVMLGYAVFAIDVREQGGALSLYVSSLDDRIAVAFADIPSNCMMTERVKGEYGSFGTVANYLRRYPERTDKVLETLSYFDLINLTERITCPVYASVGLKDNVCPAKMFFAAYNRITSEKHINIQPFMGHEVRQNMVETKLEILRKLL